MGRNPHDWLRYKHCRGVGEQASVAWNDKLLGRESSPMGRRESIGAVLVSVDFMRQKLLISTFFCTVYRFAYWDSARHANTSLNLCVLIKQMLI